jgi:hypothetical protein
MLAAGVQDIHSLPSFSVSWRVADDSPPSFPKPRVPDRLSAASYCSRELSSHRGLAVTDLVPVVTDDRFVLVLGLGRGKGRL